MGSIDAIITGRIRPFRSVYHRTGLFRDANTRYCWDTTGHQFVSVSEKRHARANDMPLELVTWDVAENEALRKLLEMKQTLTVDRAHKCVDHYYRSDVNISGYPRTWIARLLEYWYDPVNQYGTPHSFDKAQERENKRRGEANVGRHV